jgi:tRNA pseudouridine55 synthase
MKKMVPRGCKVGHSRTLDPFASGLLIAAVGRATKAIQYVMAMEKIYDFI